VEVAVNEEEQTYLTVAVELGLLSAEQREEIEDALVEIKNLGQPVSLEDLLEVRGQLTQAQIRRVRASWAERSATERAGVPPRPAPVAKVGVRGLPGYGLERRLGESVVGPIELVRRLADGRRCVLKVIDHPALAEEARLTRLLDAGARLQALRSVHLAEVLEVGRLGGGAYLIGAAIAGRTFYTRLREGLRYRHVLRAALGTIRGLQVLHASGLAHGAVRPAHIFIEANRRVRLGGHEIPMLLRAAGVSSSQPKAFEPFCAPELAPGEASTSGDTYALGVVLYLGLADRLPGQDPRPLSELLTVVDARLDSLVTSCLSPEPVRRPDIEELLDRFEFLAGAAAVQRVLE
jgi:serine/threonine protein kinase